MNTSILKSIFAFTCALFLLSSCLQDDPRVDWGAITPLIELPYVTHDLWENEGTVGEDVTFDLMVNYTISDKKDNKNDIPVELAVNEALVDKYNADNQSSYVLLPPSCYTLPEMITITKGTQMYKSDFIVRTTELEPGKFYILPVIIHKIPEGYMLSGNFNVVYIRIDL